MEETREIDIDIRKILYMMRTKIIYILLITLSAGALTGIYTHFFIPPTYTAKCSFCVTSNPARTNESAISANELSATTSLVKTYMVAFKTNTVLDQVAEDVGVSSVKGYVSTTQDGDTAVFYVTVSCNDPQLASEIANSICKIAPSEVPKRVKAGSVTVLDTAVMPTAPSAPNTKKNILTGLLVGFVLSFALFFAIELFDTSITNARDLEREFDLPVLGTVPLLEAVEKAPREESDDLAPPEPPITAPRPSASLLENIQQSMKGGSDND
ncbi:MAG: hypothetical protein IJ168_07055 [Eubacterium sp.]|nr:hypothetical protein [Eubacterium sp.]